MEYKQRVYQTTLTKYLFSRANKGRLPLSGTFELSPVCNFSCRMCYVRKTAQEVARHSRPMVTMEQWLALAEQARQQGMLYLLLTGGEPFLWPDFWELYEKLSQMGFLISINTNGSLIDDAAIEKLREMPPTRINITLYGASDETYEALCRAKGVFTKVDHAIRGLKEAGIQVKLNCSLTPYNAEDLEAMCRYAADLDLYIDVNTYMFPPIRRSPGQVGENDRFTPEEAAYYHLKRYRIQQGEEDYRTLLGNIRKGIVPPPGLDESCRDPVDGQIRCQAGRSAFWATWDGWLSACGMAPEPRVELMGRSFSEAWQELTEKCNQVALSGTCKKCADRNLCHSCMAMAEAETGSPSGIPTYLCQMVREMKKIAENELDQSSETADATSVGRK